MLEIRFWESSLARVREGSGLSLVNSRGLKLLPLMNAFTIHCVYRLLGIALLLFSTQLASAEDPANFIRQSVHRVWTTEDGLPQNSVNAIIQTKDGYLWMGTQEGLVRFNGATFTIFDKIGRAS